MHLAAPSRRALGLAAASTMALSTTVLGLGGVAQAAEELLPLYYSSYEDDAGFTVAEGYCFVTFDLVGGTGGEGYLAPADVDSTPTYPAGAPGGVLEVTVPVTAAQQFTFGSGEDGGYADQVDGGGASGTGAYPGADGGEVADPADPSVYVEGGGGGGSASWVLSGSSSLVAFGGGGGGDLGGAGGSGGTAGTNTVAFAGSAVVTNGPAAAGSSSYVAAEVLPCVAPPLAPTGLAVVAGDGSLDVRFTPAWNDAPNSSQPETWEYKLGDGAWTAVDTASVQYSADRTFSLSGLTNGTSYAVQVRGISEEGRQGAAAAAVPGVPFASIGAPGNVAVTTTPTSVTVSWTAPTVAGTFPLAGYGVGLGAGEMGGEVCTTAADVLSCTVTGVQAGMDYSVVVYAYDSKGGMGAGSPFVMTGAIPFPASVPASDGALAGSGFSTGSVTPGQSITVSGTGYAPFSTVTVLVYSSPTVLGTAVADENGAFTFTGTLPAGLAAGSHTLVAAGIDVDGNPRYLTQAITVGADTDSGGLAYTGADIALPLAGGAAALLLGGGLLVASRRRANA